MNVREWIADNLIYRFGGCFYSRTHDHVFDQIASVVPEKFMRRHVSDLGCGDGTNTQRIKEVFKAKSITGYELNEHLVKRAREKSLKIKKSDLDKKVPKGELATFVFALHHIKDKEKCLRKVKKNFDLVFLIEPTNDLYHRLFDAGDPLSENEWKELFDKVFGKYSMHRYKSSVVVFYSK